MNRRVQPPDMEKSMSQLSVNGVVTMSSRDIADLVQSKHSDVKRSAERLVAAGILTAPLAQFDFEHNGNVYQEYRFNKRDSLVIVARLSPEFTAAVVDRWQGRKLPQPEIMKPIKTMLVQRWPAWLALTVRHGCESIQGIGLG